MSHKTARMEVRRLLDSIQVQIVSTTNHLQLLTEQYQTLHALSQKMHEEVVSKVGKVKAKDRVLLPEDEAVIITQSWYDTFENIIPKPEFPSVKPTSDDQPKGDE